MINIYPSVYKHRPNKFGEWHVVLVVTINGKAVHYERLNKWLSPAEWNDGKIKNKTVKIVVDKRRNEILEQIYTRELLGEKISPAIIKHICTGKADNDFYTWAKEQINIHYPDKERQKETIRQAESEITKMQQFKPLLMFSEIDVSFLRRYKAWMIEVRKNKPNTVWKSLKFINTFMNIAVKDGVIKASPFENFDRGRYRQTERHYLTKDELNKLEKKIFELSGTIQQVGHYFLFMCYTGLRFSDAINFDFTKHVTRETISLKVQKTGEYVKIPLNAKINRLINCIKANPLSITNQSFNRIFKTICDLVPMRQVTAHTARHTFATVSLEIGIPIHVIQKLLGHTNIRTTMIYEHITDKSLGENMSKWDKV